MTKFLLTQKPQINYNAENCWSTLDIPLMYNLVLWNRFLKKNFNYRKDNWIFHLTQKENKETVPAYKNIMFYALNYFILQPNMPYKSNLYVKML